MEISTESTFKPKLELKFIKNITTPLSERSKPHSKTPQRFNKKRFIETFVNSVHTSREEPSENSFPPSSYRFPDKLQFKPLQRLHKLNKKYLLPEENSLLSSYNNEDASPYLHTPRKKLNYLQKLFENLTDQQFLTKTQISSPTKTIESLKNESEIDSSFSSKIQSRFPLIRHEKSPIGKSFTDRVKFLDLKISKKEDFLFTFRVADTKELTREDSNFPKSENCSPVKVLRFPREIFTNKVKRIRH
ncbi:unnamed protein product [Blepharisma stoltei]|uniref:Uncharacterized protein n=1 Tax=Blepharisma stoltei TaxID=1481888 RepID=A0AAU9IVE3_9CILI|nr:unnamed protein product [Blepharisma stoltei]